MHEYDMAEPASTTSVTLTAISIGILGPLAGPYALIVMAALAGALWPLSTMGHVTRRKGAYFLLKVVMTAVILTGASAYFLEERYAIPAFQSFAVIAFFIGALGNGWSPVFDALSESLAVLVRGVFGRRQK